MSCHQFQPSISSTHAIVLFIHPTAQIVSYELCGHRDLGLMRSVCDELEAPLQALSLHAELLRQQLDNVSPGQLTQRLDAMLAEVARMTTTLDSLRGHST